MDRRVQGDAVRSIVDRHLDRLVDCGELPGEGLGVERLPVSELPRERMSRSAGEVVGTGDGGHVEGDVLAGRAGAAPGPAVTVACLREVERHGGAVERSARYGVGGCAERIAVAQTASRTTQINTRPLLKAKPWAGPVHIL